MIYSNVTLGTVNGNRGLILNTGPIRTTWQNDSGETLAYDFKDVVYNPTSPFNILYVARVGQHFVSVDSPMTND